MSNHRNRQRRQGRRVPFLDPKPLILVLCEGQKTEPQYLDGFKKAFHNPRVEVKIATEHGVPKSLVETAKKYKKEREEEASNENDDNLAYDAVWCVFDVDTHPNVPDAKQMARDNGIQTAISNPCFELWLLLHFREPPGPEERSKLHAMLSTHLPDYHKHIEFDDYFPGYDEAVKRARRLDQLAETCGDLGRNPTTNVYVLTELMRTK